MSNELTINDKEILYSNKKAKSAGEIFNGIVSSIRASHDEDISDQEARQLARNFIGFCQKIIDIQLRIEREAEEKART